MVLWSKNPTISVTQKALLSVLSVSSGNKRELTCLSCITHSSNHKCQGINVVRLRPENTSNLKRKKICVTRPFLILVNTFGLSEFSLCCKTEITEYSRIQNLQTFRSLHYTEDRFLKTNEIMFYFCLPLNGNGGLVICQQQKTLIPTVQFLSLISRICNAGVKTGTKPTCRCRLYFWPGQQEASQFCQTDGIHCLLGEPNYRSVTSLLFPNICQNIPNQQCGSRSRL